MGNIFFKDDPDAEAKKAAKATAKANKSKPVEAPQPIQPIIPTTRTVSNMTGVADEKFVEMLKGVIADNNIPGQDYFELKQLDFDTAVHRDLNEFLFFKNFPDNNNLKEKTEFCVVQKISNNILKFRIECKSQELQGSSYRTIEHVIEQYRENKIKNNETALIIVYGGKYYDEKSRLAEEIINNIKNNIRHSYDILFLSTNEFKNFMNEYLKNKNLMETIKKYK
jgi:hypothetical protein